MTFPNIGLAPLKALFLFLALSLVSGCTGIGMATGAGAGVGMAAAQEGGIPAAVTDLKIQTEINSLWFQHDVEIFRKLDLTVKQGRVLVTGVVQDPEARVEAIRMAWQPRGVKQVINEIRVAESDGLPGFARDSWITAQLRAKLVFAKEVQSINYTIDTVQGVVYLMGVAQNQDELNRAIDIARTISGVKQVVSYVKFAGQPLTEEELEARREASMTTTMVEESDTTTTTVYEAPVQDAGVSREWPSETVRAVPMDESQYIYTPNGGSNNGRPSVQSEPLQ
ncbi:MAG: phospholipid-binding domain-containing protein [Micavibrio sp.]|nr:phospholipid-binding domain-containing protein [Micavibrio sp.]